MIDLGDRVSVGNKLGTVVCLPEMPVYEVNAAWHSTWDLAPAAAQNSSPDSYEVGDKVTCLLSDELGSVTKVGADGIGVQFPGQDSFDWAPSSEIKTTTQAGVVYLDTKYSEDEPRVPAGGPGGGEWAGDNSDSSSEEEPHKVLDGWIDGSKVGALQSADEGKDGGYLAPGEHAAFVTLLDSLPKFDGMAYRSIWVEKGGAAALGLKPGGKVQFKFNQSASQSINTAMYYASDKQAEEGGAGTKVLLSIHTKTAADLSHSARYMNSEFAEQKEVVLRPGAKYRIGSIDDRHGFSIANLAEI